MYVDMIDLTNYNHVLKVSYDNGDPYLLLFKSEKEYLDWLETAIEEQPYTGLTWKSIYASNL